jgi:uncharacterized protein YkvS
LKANFVKTPNFNDLKISEKTAIKSKKYSKAIPVTGLGCL